MNNWSKEFDLLWGIAPEGSLKYKKREVIKDFIREIMVEPQKNNCYTRITRGVNRLDRHKFDYEPNTKMAQCVKCFIVVDDWVLKELGVELE